MTTEPLCLELATEAELSAAAEAGDREARRLLLERCRLLARIAAAELRAALERACLRNSTDTGVRTFWQKKVLTKKAGAATVRAR